MNPKAKALVTWGVTAIAVVGFVALLVWLLMTPDDAPVIPPTEPAPCVCPTPELPPTLPETGKSL